VRKLLDGIVEFKRRLDPESAARFAAAALGQSPDAFMIACSDSRVVPNVFGSTDPGDMFVARNVGNMVSPAGPLGVSTADQAEASAIEFAVAQLGVADVIVCGHSSCGAMRAALAGFEDPTMPNLSAWLRHATPAVERLRAGHQIDASRPTYDQLSQLNVLEQMRNVTSYPVVKQAIAAGKLGVHGMWFEIATATVHYYDPQDRRFMPIDTTTHARILSRLGLVDVPESLRPPPVR
jgi:carbonic anhydrase